MLILLKNRNNATYALPIFSAYWSYSWAPFTGPLGGLQECRRDETAESGSPAP